MKEFGRSCKKKGLTPEMLYRAADTEKTSEIPTKDFKHFLESIKFSLPKPKISRLIYILDENFDGSILEQEYLNTVDAYNISGENNSYGTKNLYYQKTVL